MINKALSQFTEEELLAALEQRRRLPQPIDNPNMDLIQLAAEKIRDSQFSEMSSELDEIEIYELITEAIYGSSYDEALSDYLDNA